MSTTLPITYAHTIEHFEKGIDERGPYYKVQYKIDNWADSDFMCMALMGIVGITGGVGGVQTRQAPHQHPLATFLRCTYARVTQGLGRPRLNASGYPDFDGGALVEAEYRMPILEFGPIVSGNPDLNAIDNETAILWCTQELDFSYEMVTVEKSQLKYAAGPQVGEMMGVPAKYRVPITKMVLTFHQVPYMPMGQIRALAGKVNDDTFLGSPRGCVLFEGAKTTREYSSDGTVNQKVVLSLAEKPLLSQWNFAPSQKSIVHYLVTSDGTAGGTTMYPYASFLPLLALNGS